MYNTGTYGISVKVSGPDRLREEVVASLVKFIKIPTAKIAVNRLIKPLGKIIF